MAGTPIKLTLYDPQTNEVKKELVKTFVPWKMLKRALALYRELNGKDMNALSEQDVDCISGLVIELFGEDRVSLAELDESCDITELLSVIQQISGKAAGLVPNPSPQA